jgi:hypothetical protein
VNKNKVLVVYNTCGIKCDNTDWYIKCINSLLNQDFDDFKVVLSSCLNSPECFKQVYDTFRDKISYCYHAEPHTVNITFNKTVQECVKRFGEFESYLYVDSGCSFGDQTDILEKAYKNFKLNEYGILSIQTDTDTGFQGLGLNFKNDAQEAQVVGKDYIIPLGKAINLHLNIFHNDLYKLCEKIIPDVFAAHCTESTFNYLCASVNRRWAIMKDVMVSHRKSLDGATLCVPHWSPVHRNRWNNLLYGRNALDFINNKEVYRVGLGYEECNNILNYNPGAYDSDNVPLDRDGLTRVIKEFLFLTEKELDYNQFKTKFI